MTRRKGTKPEQFAGPFQSFSDIPPRYQLEIYSNRYESMETWEQYCEDILFETHDSTHMRNVAEKAGQSWRAHMEQRGRHHALATPADANEWCKKLLSEGRCRRTCYEQYFVRIYQFYDHLKTSHRHPHLYNPLLLAAIEYEAARYIWMFRVDTRPEVVSRE